MELIIWRHAEAEPRSDDKPDADRVLTAKGHKQAKKMAAWLDRTLPGHCRILVSPARRTVQTAEALDRKYKLAEALSHDSTPQQILQAVNWPEMKEPVLIVGHQPAIGRLASLLIAGIEQDWIIRKGAVIWIAQKALGESQGNYLKAAVGPDLAGKA